MLQTNSKEIIRHLKTMGIKNNSLIFLHIDVKGLGILKNGLDEIYRAFDQILSKGVLVTPAFTYSWSKKKKFTRLSKCNNKEIGVFANFFLKKKKILRSKNPNFSLAVLDNTKNNVFTKTLLNQEDYTSCFGQQSLFGKIFEYSKQNSSYIILFGGAHNDVIFRTTFLHFIEEMCNVPYRFIKKIYEPHYKKKFILQYSRILSKKEAKIHNFKMNNFKIPVSPKYKKLGDDLLRENILFQKKFKYSVTRTVNLKNFCDWLFKKISKDKLYLLK